jgi:hypothetical protein
VANRGVTLPDFRSEYDPQRRREALLVTLGAVRKDLSDRELEELADRLAEIDRELLSREG